MGSPSAGWCASGSGFFDPGRAPALGHHLFAREDRTSTAGLTGFALVERTTAAGAGGYVVFELGLVDPAGIFHVTEGYGLGILLAHHRGNGWRGT